MLDADKREFSDILNATLPIYRMEASKETKRLWWEILKRHEIKAVSVAFSEHVTQNGKGITPADITKLIELASHDGRPGSDEAWAMIPRDEAASAVMTTEMAEAMGVAQPLLDEGDQVAARMAFKAAYERIVTANKMAGVEPKWFPSLGYDKACRESVLANAVRLGRLGADQALNLLPPDKQTNMQQGAGAALMIENRPCSEEKARENLEKMKTMLAGAPLKRVLIE